MANLRVHPGSRGWGGGKHACSSQQVGHAQQYAQMGVQTTLFFYKVSESI